MGPFTMIRPLSLGMCISSGPYGPLSAVAFGPDMSFTWNSGGSSEGPNNRVNTTRSSNRLMLSLWKMPAPAGRAKARIRLTTL